MNPEIKNLLQSSVREFQDKKQNATAIPCVYLPAKNGLAYLIKDTARQINTSCAIHINTNQEQREDGIYDTGFVRIDTQKNIFEEFTEYPDTIIVNYQGYIFGINKSGDFNPEASTYHYSGEILINRNDKYIIVDESEAATLILSDSTTKWLDLQSYFGIPVYPSFISTFNINDTFMVISIRSSDAMNIVRQTDDTTLKQYKKDLVRIHLINADLQTAQLIAKRVFESSEKYGTFGVMDFPGWKTINEYTQSSFGIKQNIRYMDLRINYQLETASESAIQYFKQISATINAAKIITQTLI